MANTPNAEMTITVWTVGSPEGTTKSKLRDAVRSAYLDGETDGPRSYAGTAWVVKERCCRLATRLAAEDPLRTLLIVAMIS